MFTDKSHINTLVSALASSGVTHIVACPGSRNAPIIHDCHEAGLHLHPVTDERSAGFVAIGLSLSAGLQPVAVCVTSGSAMLNLLPAVSEAYYRQIPLLVISADRPAEWIGHLDGQTIPQIGALMPYAASYVIVEGCPCEATLGSALAALYREGGRPVHLNVHIDEPLFRLNISKLPVFDSQSCLNADKSSEDFVLDDEIVTILRRAKRPVLVIGAYDREDLRDVVSQIASRGVVVYADIHSQIDDGGRFADYERRHDTDIETDLIIHVGGAFVGKYLKLALRRAAMTRDIPVIRVDETESAPDTFRGRLHKLTVSSSVGLRCMAQYIDVQTVADANPLLESRTLSTADGKMTCYARIGEALTRYAETVRLSVFLANSTTPRAISAAATLRPGTFPIYINRGVNGIEGSTSVAVGYALGCDRTTVLITGDLSFFYDANALWNSRLRGNLRVVLVNDQCGGIFAGLPSFAESPALHDYIAASHSATAEGIALSYGCGYTRIEGVSTLSQLTDWLSVQSDQPQILEILLNHPLKS